MKKSGIDIKTRQLLGHSVSIWTRRKREERLQPQAYFKSEVLVWKPPLKWDKGSWKIAECCAWSKGNDNTNMNRVSSLGESSYSFGNMFMIVVVVMWNCIALYREINYISLTWSWTRIIRNDIQDYAVQQARARIVQHMYIFLKLRLQQTKTEQE